MDAMHMLDANQVPALPQKGQQHPVYRNIFLKGEVSGLQPDKQDSKILRGVIPNAKWDAARTRIETLYRDENESCEYVINALRKEHGFYPT